MAEIIKILMEIVNNVHDSLQYISDGLNISFNDKQLHFIIIGVIGIIIFAFTQALFKWLSKFSITAISFIHTFTLLLVIVFAIEIGQKITNRGHMEFADIVAGIMGFMYLFAIYLVIKLLVYLVKSFFGRKDKVENNNCL
jgi:ABC-type amino acid transport system permease subunit